MVTKEQFDAYEDVRESGATNMFAVNVVSDLSGLDRETILEIMKNYGTLKAQFSPEKTLDKGTEMGHTKVI